MQVKKLFCCFLTLVMLFVFGACQNNTEQETEFHVSGFDGEKLYVDYDGKSLVYERYKPGIDSLTKDTMLDLFIMDTAIEGIAWEVWSTEEHPDLSYVLLISGTNSFWTFRITE